MGRGKSLQEILQSEKFRKKVYSNFGESFGFWVYTDGNTSEIIRYDSLKPFKRKLQDHGRKMIERDFNPLNKEKIRRDSEEDVRVALPYAKAQSDLAIAELKGEPRLIVDIDYDPISLETAGNITRAMTPGVADTMLGKPIFTLTDALLMDELFSLGTVFTKVSHSEEKPSPSYVGLYNQKIAFTRTLDIGEAHYAYGIAISMAQGKVPKDHPIFKLYDSAFLIINPEQGLIENPVEIKKELEKIE